MIPPGRRIWGSDETQPPHPGQAETHQSQLIIDHGASEWIAYGGGGCHQVVRGRRRRRRNAGRERWMRDLGNLRDASLRGDAVGNRAPT